MSGETLNLSSTHNLFDPAAARPVIIIGAGSIGSHTAIQFAKRGVRDITVCDPDTVDSANVPASAYRQKIDIGASKVAALKEIIYEATGLVIRAIDEAYDGSTRLRGTIISCVDQMNTGRKVIWKNVEGNLQTDLFCDSRIHGSYSEIYAVDPHNDQECAWYNATLFDDADAARQMCGRHTDITTAVRTASVIVAKTCEWWTSRQKGEWIFAERCDTLRRVF